VSSGFRAADEGQTRRPCQSARIAVSPARQGLGLGRRLLAFAEAEALRRGYCEIRLYSIKRWSRISASTLQSVMKRPDAAPRPDTTASSCASSSADNQALKSMNLRDCILIRTPVSAALKRANAGARSTKEYDCTAQSLSSKYGTRVGRVAKQIKAIPLMIIPPPMAPRAMTVGPISEAAISGAAQTMAPMIQSAVPTMIFIADQRPK
jgi:hypothetical protein